jgi:uncharacterized protein (DUF849 family)
MSPHLPLTPDQIVEEALKAAEAGAAIIHLHARNPSDGKPTSNPDVFMDFLPRIKQASNCVINISTGGGLGMSIEERLAAAVRAQPELCSLNMGSMNFGLFHVVDKYATWKFDWEKPYLENTKRSIVSNTFSQIEYILEKLGKGYGTKFECECYDIGHLYTLAHFVDRKLIIPPLFVQSVFGVLGGIGTHIEDITHMKRTADRLFGHDYRWSVLAAGRHQMPLTTVAAIMGGNVRVGLEDSLYIGKGKLAQSSADQVKCIRSILESLSLDIATPDEARTMLVLKGADRVAF